MRRRRGFTLVEVLVAAALTAVGVASLVGALAGMTRLQATAQSRDTLARLAQEKFDELRATRAYESETEGSFDGAYANTYDWSCEVVQTGTENLIGLRVTATQRDRQVSTTVEGLIFEPPVTTDGEGQGA